MSNFSWRSVKNHRYVPPGKYAQDCFDQHHMSWCGACYLVAAVQCVEDRIHVEAGRKKMKPFKYLSMQTVMDHFQEFDAEPGWNACHGGFSMHVFKCLVEQRCPVLFETEREWRGHPTEPTPTPSSQNVTLYDPRRLNESEVKLCLYTEGPVVLEISAATLLSIDSTGTVTDVSYKEPNHAVCVVGWKGDHWIVRNSWGRERVPKNIPADLSCVSYEDNECDVEFVPWGGDPNDLGFCFLPMECKALHASSPSPWMCLSVQLK